MQQNNNGLNMKEADSIDYVRFIAKYAATLGLKTGLKNSLSIIPKVADLMSFAVNEECGKFSECDSYNGFIQSGKPVYHIEYVAKPPTITNAEKGVFCSSVDTAGFSTVMKNMTLNGWVAYCDGSTATTETTPGGIIPGKPPNPHPSSTMTTTTTSFSWSNTTFTTTTSPTTSHTYVASTTTTSKPLTTIKTSSTTSSAKPTSSTPAPGGGGCAQKHWDQCGGNDWKGCTTCAVSSMSNPVSASPNSSTRILILLASRLAFHAKGFRHLITINVFNSAYIGVGFGLIDYGVLNFIPSISNRLKHMHIYICSWHHIHFFCMDLVWFLPIGVEK
jgi:hypothetical protein